MQDSERAGKKIKYCLKSFVWQSGETMDNLLLEAGDDAGKVKWVDISEKLKLYANHGNFIKLVAEKWGAHWNEDPVPGCHK